VNICRNKDELEEIRGYVSIRFNIPSVNLIDYWGLTFRLFMGFSQKVDQWAQDSKLQKMNLIMYDSGLGIILSSTVLTG
jgi:hypothetical protein